MNAQRLPLLPFLLALLTVLAPSLARAATLTVAQDGSGQYANIQDAIDAAQSGDTVKVGDGTYTGLRNVNLDFAGKLIQVVSTHGVTSTIIDCAGFPGRGFYFHNGEGAGAIVSGFTIENGSPSLDGAFDAGGGMKIVSSSPSIINCRFFNNSGQGGGGIWISHNSTPSIANCSFVQNSAQVDGGGVWVYDNSAPVISGCSFRGNHGYEGGAVCIIASNPKIINCAMTANTASFGGGFEVYYGSTPTLANISLAENRAVYGGAMSVLDSGSPVLTNCILWNDTASVAGPEVQGSISPTYSDIQGGYTGVSNINADPLFVNAAGDLHLKPGSPCFGTGTPEGAPTTDLDGTPRPNPPSMGAYERPVVPVYTLVDLGTLGGPNSSAKAINNRGQVVGDADGADSQSYPFLYSDGGMRNLMPPGYFSLSLNSINDKGQMAGRVRLDRWSLATACVISGGALSVLDSPTDGYFSSSAASSINNTGQVVGSASPGELPDPVIWDDGVGTDLESDFRGTGSANAINDAGQVVGSLYGGGGTYSTVLWQPGSPLQIITGQNSAAPAINTYGNVAGTIGPGASQESAFFWSGGDYVPIATLGGSISYGSALNDADQVVGYSVTGDGRTHAFIYSGGQVCDLNSRIAPNSGFELNWATGINNSGQICGWGTVGDHYHAFLLTPIGVEASADASKVALTADGVTGDADGIVCDNLSDPSGAHDADGTKDHLMVKLTGYPGATVGSISVVNTDGRFAGANTDSNGDNDAGHAITAQNSSGDVWYFPPDEFNEVQRPRDPVQHPEDFTHAATRAVTLTVHFTASDGIRYVVNKRIVLARPPVVLVHGINNDPSNWNPLIGRVTADVSTGNLGISVPFTTVNHADPRSFSQPLDGGNAPVEIGAQLLSERINATLVAVRSGTMISDTDENVAANNEVHQFTGFIGTHLAAKRVDVVAWSYGGAITRWYLANKPPETGSWYQRPFSYIRQKDGVPISYDNAHLPAVSYGDDVRKVITLGTMWRGVPLANYANEATFSKPNENRLTNGIRFYDAPGLAGILSVASHLFPTEKPSFEVMAVNSRWMSQMIYGQSQVTQAIHPFDDGVAYGSVAGDNDAYLLNHGDTYQVIDDAQQLSDFPYLRLEFRRDAPRNYNDGIVPLWSAAIPGSYKIAPCNHSDYVNDPDTVNYVVQWLSNAALPKGTALNDTWKSSGASVQSADGSKTWTFRTGEMAPHAENDLYRQVNSIGRQDTIGRISPVALREVNTSTVSGVTSGSATVSWQTAADMDSELKLYQSSSTLANAVQDVHTSAPTKNHLINLTGLLPNTTYYYEASSTLFNPPADTDGNYRDVVVSTNHASVLHQLSFHTPAAAQPIISVSVLGPNSPSQPSFTLSVSNKGGNARAFTVTGLRSSPGGYGLAGLILPINVGAGQTQTLPVNYTAGPTTAHLLCQVTYRCIDDNGSTINGTTPYLKIY